VRISSENELRSSLKSSNNNHGEGRWEKRKKRGSKSAADDKPPLPRHGFNKRENHHRKKPQKASKGPTKATPGGAASISGIEGRRQRPPRRCGVEPGKILGSKVTFSALVGRREFQGKKGQNLILQGQGREEKKGKAYRPTL